MAHPRRGAAFQRNKALASYQIGRSIPCLGCQYNLRGLSYSHHCPECGKPAAYTIEQVLKSEETETKVGHLRHGLRLNSVSWGLYLLLIVACLHPSCTLLMLSIVPIMRLSAIMSFRKVEGALPCEWPVSLGVIGGLATGTLCTTLLFLAISVILPGPASLLMGIFFIIMIGIEGFVWMSTLGKYARSLEVPLVGPIASVGRMGWIPVTIVTALLFAASIGLSNSLIDNLAQLSLVFGFGFCGAMTAIVTELFSDIIRQLAIIGELETKQDPILIWPKEEKTAPAATSPVDIAPQSDATINLPDMSQPLRDPREDRPDKGNDPNNPTGVY